MPLQWKTAFFWLICNPPLDYRSNAKPFIKIIEASMSPNLHHQPGKISKGALHTRNSRPTHPPKTNHHAPSLIPP